MKEIQLTKGKVALVDDEDFDRVNKYKWCANFDGKNWYAIRKHGRKFLSMHRFIKPGHSMLDHKDGDGLNNQKINLRPTTNGQNSANSRKSKGRSSRFKGVYWLKRNQVWAAQITALGKQMHLGCFDSEILAAKAYDAAAKIHFKDFARPNFP